METIKYNELSEGIEISAPMSRYQMKKIFRHIKRWNRWRKRCLNGKLHKALVLLGITKSPTMPFFLLPEEETEIARRVKANPKEVMDAPRNAGATMIYFYVDIVEGKNIE